MSVAQVNIYNAHLLEVLEKYPDIAEKTINDVLHNEGGQLIQDSIRPFIPVSGKNWRGKKSPARSSNSMRSENINLAVWVKSAKSYQYLYFPDDGTNTRRHVGNQRFFMRGAQVAADDITERITGRLVENFEKGE